VISLGLGKKKSRKKKGLKKGHAPKKKFINQIYKTLILKLLEIKKLSVIYKKKLNI